MNNARRKAIREIVKKLETIEEEICFVKENTETLKDEEEEYLENIPENFQNSERYEKAEDAFCNLESAIDLLDCLDIDEIIKYLEESMI